MDPTGIRDAMERATVITETMVTIRGTLAITDPHPMRTVQGLIAPGVIAPIVRGLMMSEGHIMEATAQDFVVL